MRIFFLFFILLLFNSTSLFSQEDNRWIYLLKSKFKYKTLNTNIKYYFDSESLRYEGKNAFFHLKTVFDKPIAYKASDGSIYQWKSNLGYFKINCPKRLITPPSSSYMFDTDNSIINEKKLEPKAIPIAPESSHEAVYFLVCDKEEPIDDPLETVEDAYEICYESNMEIYKDDKSKINPESINYYCYGNWGYKRPELIKACEKGCRDSFKKILKIK